MKRIILGLMAVFLLSACAARKPIVLEPVSDPAPTYEILVILRDGIQFQYTGPRPEWHPGAVLLVNETGGRQLIPWHMVADILWDEFKEQAKE